MKTNPFFVEPVSSLWRNQRGNYDIAVPLRKNVGCVARATVATFLEGCEEVGGYGKGQVVVRAAKP
jgi:hypothetical protein